MSKTLCYYSILNDHSVVYRGLAITFFRVFNEIFKYSIPLNSGFDDVIVDYEPSHEYEPSLLWVTLSW